jgi:hypothetical protein
MRAANRGDCPRGLPKDVSRRWHRGMRLRINLLLFLPCRPSVCRCRRRRFPRFPGPISGSDWRRMSSQTSRRAVSAQCPHRAGAVRGRVRRGGKARSVGKEAPLEVARGSAPVLSPRRRRSRAKGRKETHLSRTIALRHDDAKQAQMGRRIAERTKRKAARRRPHIFKVCA